MAKLRNRLRAADSNEDVINTTQDEIKQASEFATRESTLTILIENSKHIRSIYHIFAVILLVLLCDTMIFDLIDRGKMNVGLSVVFYGFGDVGRGIRLWLYELAVAVIFYPGLILYGSGVKLLKKYPGLCRLWTALGIAGLILLQTALIAVPVWNLSRKHLAVASSATVTCEMFRFAMKIHAAAVAIGPRCYGIAPLPSFGQYLYFLFAPTLIYRDHYPRTKKIRWGFVLFNFMEVAAIVFYNSFLWERFILPYWSDYGKQPTIEASFVVRGMFACILPGVISFLCGFYCLLHAWLNAFAEMLTFGDKLFYEDWWTTSQFSKYYRAWNRVVHAWLRDHIYKPLAPHTGRVFATLMVFLVSSIAHEVILALSFGFFYPVLLMQFGVCGLLMLPITATSGRRYPNTFNFVMWLSFFFGNGILWSLYPMEYFARKNCPPSEYDSFFVPKSWSCPSIVLKPNWTFHNPLDILSY
ncbi:hypothetical protein ACJJTC_001394 [Scirpophaga incertulas]